MNKKNVYISTTAPDASQLAVQYGLGIERKVLHAPFNELFPCAIDRKAGALAAERYRQANSFRQL